MERQLGAIRAERGQLSRTAESVTNPLSAGINEAEESAHERYANAIKLVEEELAVMKKLAATSLWWVDYTAKILFTLQLIFNGVIMSASSFMLPGKLMAGLALGNTVIKGLETHFKFEHTVETLREALALIKHLEHDFKHLRVDAGMSHDNFEDFKKEYDHAMKKLKAMC